MKVGKKHRAAKERVGTEKMYGLEEAVALAREVKHTKFDESLDVVMRLGVDPKHADQMVRGSVVMPHGIGKTVRVLALTSPGKETEAQEAGADYVGLEEYLPKVQEGWLEFDAIVATPDVMSQVGRLGKILGPRGLMPSPKTGGVTMDIGNAVRELKAGKVEYRVDKAGNVHAAVGKSSFDTDKLTANARAMIESVIRAKPASSKGQYIKRVAVSTTMGPCIKVDHTQLQSEIK
ncbi:MAG TPA: 50S ribosomal protein L1 [candidate division Zixibacteria bacterium]|jgi:large subunit ribosomal protein L1